MASTIAPLAMNKAALAPYKKFPKLYGERKFAKDYPTKAFPLLDLPAEVRNQIYRDVLVLDQATELDPKSTKGKRHDLVVQARHNKRYRYDVQPRLRVLRVNKQVHREASSIYYGENEFRFTNVSGWYILSSFLLTIGPDNVHLLRSITIHVPWPGDTRDGVTFPESRNQMMYMQTRLSKMGLRFRRRWHEFNEIASMRRCKKLLETSGKLTSLKLVLPDSYELESTNWSHPIAKSGRIREIQEFLDSSKFPAGLQVTLVRLHGGFAGQRGTTQADLDSQRQSCLETHVEAWRLAREVYGWELETLVYNQSGKYPVALKEGDQILRFDTGSVADEH